MRVAITGSSGFIAQHLIKALKKETKQIIEIDIKNGDNICDLPKMLNLLKGVDTVFHLATIPLEVSLKEPYRVGIELYHMSITLAELCRMGAFKTLIQVSSSEAYGTLEKTSMTEEHPMKPRTVYAAGKASSDLILQAYGISFGIDYAIARPFNNYGPGQQFGAGGLVAKTIYKVLKGERPVIYGDGSNVRDFIFVKDTVRGIIAVWKEKSTRGKIINISANNPVSVKDMIKKICEVSGQEFNPIYMEKRQADVQMHVADTKLANSLLNFKAKVSLEDGLKETIAWARKKYC